MQEDADHQENARARQRARRREAARLADLSTLGLVFPVATALGYFAGRALGGWLGNAVLGSMIGGGLGIVAGFYNLFKVARRLAREDEAVARSARSEEAGEDRRGSTTGATGEGPR